MSSMTFSGFNEIHNKLRGAHAFLSPSKYHWLNYDKERLEQYYRTFKAAERGTKLHDFAKTCIELNQKLPHSNKTLNMYVNDAIGFNMRPEQVLYYSDNCFGTADAISFVYGEDGKGILRIHDYKSGETPAKMDQLYVYAAIFCLEYRISPFDIHIELRIYQSDNIVYDTPDPQLIKDVCDIIREDDNYVNELKGGLKTCQKRTIG